MPISAWKVRTNLSAGRGAIGNEPYFTSQAGYIWSPQEYAAVFNEFAAAMGKAIQIWNLFLKDQMVSATGATDISAFATFSPSSRELSVYFVNSNDEPVSVNLNVLNYITYVQNEKWVLQGTGAADPNPILTQGNPASYEGGEVSLTLDPYSVTVIALTPAAE